MSNTLYPSLNFDLGETADMIRESVYDFASNEIAPRAAEIDDSRLLEHLVRIVLSSAG